LNVDLKVIFDQNKIETQRNENNILLSVS